MGQANVTFNNEAQESFEMLLYGKSTASNVWDRACEEFRDDQFWIF